MKFTVKREDLFRHLHPVQAVTERKSTLPILQNVLIQAVSDPAGQLRMSATDSEVSLRTVIPAEVEAEGTLALPCRRLFEIARVLPETEVSFRMADAGSVAIRCGRSRFQLSGVPPEDFPRIPEPPDSAPMDLDFHTLRSMIRRVLFAVSSEDSRYVYSGALMLVRDRDLEMAATDGHRLAVVRAGGGLWIAGKGEAGAPEFQAILSRKALASLDRAEPGEDGVLRFWRGEDHLFFASGPWLLACNMVEGHFAPYDRVIPRENDKSFRVGSGALLESVRRVGLMAVEKLHLLEFALRPGRLELVGKEPGQGEARDELDVEYDGAPVRIGFNSSYLSDFLSVVGTEQVWVDFKDSKVAGRFRPAEENPALQYTYVVMPMEFPGQQGE